MIGYNLPSISWFSVVETRFALTAALNLTIKDQRYMNCTVNTTKHSLEANVSPNVIISIVNSKKKLIIK
jgi:hypothetical protein